MGMRMRGVRGVPVLLAVGGCAVLTGCSGGQGTAKPVSAVLTARPGAIGSASPGTRPAAATGTSLAPRARPKRAGTAALPLAPPGDPARPQTQAVPKTSDVAFRNLTTDLWLAVTTGNPAYARPAFFPEAAYIQVKAISDQAYDWKTRLWGQFTLDVASAHQLVGSGAQLATVVAPTQYTTWIPVGGCDNKIGYWHLPGARVEYRKDGQVSSFGIASLISWRGVWYVVHFGGVERTGGGLVDQPAAGEGVPGPPGGC
jgi:hypothetical protein